MAVIRYSINKDANGNAVVVRDVLHMGPGDEVTFVSDTPNTAVRCTGPSPFTSLSAGDVYKLSGTKADGEHLLVAKPLSSSVQWECGEVDAAGNFKPWPGAGPGFPGSGPDF